MAERVDVQFSSGGVDCAAWLYRPEQNGHGRPVPVVVMAHGLGATRAMHLAPFAERFAAAGLAALVFDYRRFGDSAGTPRAVVSVADQVADYLAAAAYARTRRGLDPNRVALWGTSFAGGHVLAAAGRDPRVAAVVAQCPFTDGWASAKAAGLGAMARLAPLAVADSVRGAFGQEPVRVPVAGFPGTTALMTAVDALPGYRALLPDGVPLRTVAARSGMRIAAARPGRKAARVRCPMLVCVCEHDTVAPAERTVRLTGRAPLADVRVYPYGHFDIYSGAPFERVVTDQVEFLSRVLLPAG
ncbi:MAG: alpha/beta hydrolase [Mycobacterium sp.]|nr:alpha/beta hydrolase [Mycobacterium sp.]MCW2746395.1 alpha/beta hydrolase [Mycobacterium sp.]